MRDYGAAFLRPDRAALDAPLPQRRRRDPGADARTAEFLQAQRLRQRRAAAARGRHRSCSIPHAATPACARNGAWATTALGGDLRRPHRRGEEPRPGGARLPRAAGSRAPMRASSGSATVRRARTLAAGQSRFHLLRHAARRRRWRGISPAATCSCSRATAKPSATSRWKRWPAACRRSPSTTAPRASTCATASMAPRSPMATTTASSPPACASAPTTPLRARDGPAPARAGRRRPAPGTGRRRLRRIAAGPGSASPRRQPQLLRRRRPGGRMNATLPQTSAPPANPAGACAPTAGATHAARARYFAAISRLGDGVFWYVLMAALIVVDGMRRPGRLRAPGRDRRDRADAVQAAQALDAAAAAVRLATRASTPGWRRWTSSASRRATRCTRSLSAWSRWRTTRCWRGCWCRSPPAWRSRAWCWACTIRATCWRRPAIGSGAGGVVAVAGAGRVAVR